MIYKNKVNKMKEIEVNNIINFLKNYDLDKFRYEKFEDCVIFTPTNEFKLKFDLIKNIIHNSELNIIKIFIKNNIIYKKDEGTRFLSRSVLLITMKLYRRVIIDNKYIILNYNDENIRYPTMRYLGNNYLSEFSIKNIKEIKYKNFIIYYDNLSESELEGIIYSM